MLVFQLALLLPAFFMALTNVHAPLQRSSPKSPADNPRQIPRLQLTTKVVGQCYKSGGTLRLSLNLEFKNNGGRAVILYKDSSVIGRYFVSRNPERAAKKRYEMDVSPMKSVLGSKLHFDSPDYNQFSLLNPGDSLSVETVLYLPLKGDEGMAKDNLASGEHVLQVKAWTWYYHPRFSRQLREEWEQRGYLWSDSVVSSPMSFTVAPEQSGQRCRT
jgi:hypothetical protein